MADHFDLMSMIHRNVGLGGLVRAGADIYEILTIRMVARKEMGITEDQDDAAWRAYRQAEKINKNALIMKLPHQHWVCLTDLLFGSFHEFLIILPDKSVIIHPFCELESLIRNKFPNAKWIEDMYFQFTSDTDEIIQFFRDYEAQKHH